MNSLPEIIKMNNRRTKHDTVLSGVLDSDTEYTVSNCRSTNNNRTRINRKSSKRGSVRNKKDQRVSSMEREEALAVWQDFLRGGISTEQLNEYYDRIYLKYHGVATQEEIDLGKPSERDME